MVEPILLYTILSLFDGGAGGTGGAGGAGAAGAAGNSSAAGSGSAQGTGGSGPGGSAGAGKSGPVLYGKQPGAASGSGAGSGAGDSAGSQAPGPGQGGKQPERQSTSDTLEERRQRYQAMIQGEFKDLYEEDARRSASRMEHSLRELEARSAASQPVLDMLLERYKIPGGDMAKLLQAVENDDAYWSEAAEEAGMSVDQYKQLQKLQRENAALLRAQRQRLGEERANNQLRLWHEQAQQLKDLYPSFDLAREAKDPNFLSMLRAGVPVRQAFEVIHMEEIKAAAAAVQAKATEKAVTDGIRARGARPQENGAGAGAGFTIKDDVSRLTKKDRAEIARRAARGETIKF